MSTFQRSLKILALKFKLLGDVAVMVPALRAIREYWPEASLHALVREEAAPVLEHLPWIDRVWTVPRKMGWGGFGKVWRTLRSLRAERFDRSVDFEGNDRGAIMSRLVGAKDRLGSLAGFGFAGRHRCYTQWVEKAPNGLHEVFRDLHTLSPWKVPSPSSLIQEVHAGAEFQPEAARIVPRHGGVLAHISTSQSKKEWPVERWGELGKLAQAGGVPLYFSSGVSPREQRLLESLAGCFPEARILAPASSLGAFIALITRFGVFVSGDTGPLHLAAGLGLPTIGIFGPSDAGQWLPIGKSCEAVLGSVCGCSGHWTECQSSAPCISGVSVQNIWEKVVNLYRTHKSYE